MRGVAVPADTADMAAAHRLALLVAAACITALCTGLVIGRYAIPAGADADSASARSFDYGEPEPEPDRAIADAEANVRAAVPALEAWNADHGTYEGATLARLRTYDYGVHDVRLSQLTLTSYCLESRVDGAVASKRGPGGEIRPGDCR
jgi:hypothetical protein